VDKLDSFLAVQRFKDAGISLIDSNGTHVYRYPATMLSPEQRNWLKRFPAIQDALNGKEATAEVYGSGGERRLVAFVPIPFINWVAAASRAEGDIIQGILGMLLPHAGFMLLLTLAAFGAAVILSRPISTSIRRLHDHAAALGQGEVEKIETVHGPREIRNLAEAFNDMTEKVRSREQALRKSEQKYRAIVENMSDVVFIVDQTGKLLFITPSATRLIGYEQSEMIGHNIREFIYEEDFSPALKNIGHAVSEKGIISNEYRLRHKNGSILWMQTFTRPLFEEGDVVAVQGSFWDITERKQAEEALKASEKKFRDLITNMKEVLYTVDLEGRVTFVSASIESITGHRESEITGQPIQRIIFKDDLPKLYQNGQKIISEAAVVQNEYRVMTKTGQIRWVKTHSSPLYEGKEIVGFQGILSDITERKRVEEALRESEEKFRSLVETTSDWIWETDADGVYTYASPRVRDLLGYEPEEVLGRKPFEFMPPDESVRTWAEFSGMAKERKAFIGLENVNIGKDGRRVVLETSGVPRLDGQGNLLGYRGIDRDITDRKRAEEVLKRSHDELELLVQERTAELERRNEELQNFTFVAAHDLQEPLRKIQTFSDLLATKYFGSVNEQGRDYIKRLHETATRMRDVLQSLTKYSLLTSRVEAFGRVDLNEIARDVVADLELQIRDAGALVEIGDLPEIEADAGQMRQLFQNLLENGLKFSREGIQPIIKIHAECSSQGRECHISFNDNGIGFEEKYLESIFKPFHRLHGKDKYVGVGMGLAICSKVIEHHRGTITAKSTPGKGSIFIVTLPVEGNNSILGSEQS
jgi:PAS domain S-box-containing protein